MSTSFPVPPGLSEVAAIATRRTIPFDYSFRFDLDGEIGKSLTQTLTVSIEAAFTAVSIGYGVLPAIDATEFGLERLADLDAGPLPVSSPPVILARRRLLPSLRPSIPPSARLPLINIIIPNVPPSTKADKSGLAAGLAQSINAAIGASKKEGINTPLSELAPDLLNALVGAPRQISIGDLLRALARKLGEEQFSALGEIGPRTQFALLNGIRLNPGIAKAFLASGGKAALDPSQLSRLFETIGAEPERVQFLYALRDEGTGREFQSDFQFNVSGLGISDGDRPFRYFAVPITFAPRATIRLDIIQKSKFKGELFVSLHGYKVLGGAGTPTGRALRARRRRR